MSLCQVCRERVATIHICEADQSHMLDVVCLQEMIDIAGPEITLFKCPICNELIKPIQILSFQAHNIKISEEGVEELTAAIARVSLVNSLGSTRKLA